MQGKPVIVLNVRDGPLGDNFAVLEPVSDEWTTADLAQWVSNTLGVALATHKSAGHLLSFIDLFQAVVAAAESSPDVLLHPFTFGRIHEWRLAATRKHNDRVEAKEVGEKPA